MRELTEDESENVDCWSTHTNMSESHACCPHCDENVEMDGDLSETEGIRVMKCPNSVKLPETVEV